MNTWLWETWVILAAAGWLFFSPFFFQFANVSHPAAVLAWVSAVVLVISASEALAMPDPIEDWFDSVVGVALVLGPWLLGFGNQMVPAANSTIVGAVVLVCSISALLKETREHGTGHDWAAH